jgi:hypothetical protein
MLIICISPIKHIIPIKRKCISIPYPNLEGEQG